MANAVTNFLNWVANWTKSVILDPIVDIWSTAVKWIAGGTAALAGKDSTKIRENIDKVASQMKWEMQQPKQADSIAYAIWEWLPVWVDNAAWAVGLWMLAKQLPKAAQSWFNKILNRVKDAKSKSDQIKLAKEAREYLNAYRDPERVAKEVSNRTEVPSYQQRKRAEFNNTFFANPSERWVMEPYRWVKSTPEWQMKTISNITEEFKNNPSSNVRSMIAESQIDPDAYTAVYWPRSWWPMNTMNDATKLAPVSAATTSDVNWIGWQQYRKWTYGDRLKNTGKEFAAQKNAIDKAAKAVDYDNYADANKVAKANWFKDWKDLIKSETAWRNSKEWKEYIKQIEANDLWFKDMSEANNTFIETKAPFNSVKEMLDYISTAKKPTKWIYPKSFADRPDLMKFSGWDWSVANIADAQEKYNWYMNNYPSYLERIRNIGKNFTSQRKALDKIAKEWWFTVDQARKLAAENGTTTKKILNDSAAASRWMEAEDAKYAKKLWMTVDQLRSESLRHWLSPYSYFEHQKRLKDMWFKNMEELDKYVKQSWFESIWDAWDAYQRMWQWMNFKDFINKNSSNEYYNKVMKYDPSLYFWPIL